MKYLLTSLIFITMPCFASIADVRDRLILAHYWAEFDAREAFLNGEKVLSQYFLGKSSAFQYCLELIDEDISN